MVALASMMNDGMQCNCTDSTVNAALVCVQEQSLAAKAGLPSGARIQAINGIDIHGMDYASVVRLMEGMVECHCQHLVLDSTLELSSYLSACQSNVDRLLTSLIILRRASMGVAAPWFVSSVQSLTRFTFRQGPQKTALVSP